VKSFQAPVARRVGVAFGRLGRSQGHGGGPRSTFVMRPASRNIPTEISAVRVAPQGGPPPTDDDRVSGSPTRDRRRGAKNSIFSDIRTSVPLGSKHAQPWGRVETAKDASPTAGTRTVRQDFLKAGVGARDQRNGGIYCFVHEKPSRGGAGAAQWRAWEVAPPTARKNSLPPQRSTHLLAAEVARASRSLGRISGERRDTLGKNRAPASRGRKPGGFAHFPLWYIRSFYGSPVLPWVS